jgi:[NiFe] hydrogenase diaphorase moiety small subunit
MTTSTTTPEASFTLDGEDVPFRPGETILQAAQRAGHYVPHLCWHPDFHPHGSCRVCTVKVNGRAGAACTVQAAPVSKWNRGPTN